jgi:hypothetical protein
LLNASTIALKELIAAHPAVPLYKAVLLKKLKNDGDAEFNEVLKTTSLHVPDRKHLYHFIHSKEKINTIEFVEVETTSSNFINEMNPRMEATVIEDEKVIEKPKKHKKEEKVVAKKEEKPQKEKKEKPIVREEIKELAEIESSVVLSDMELKSTTEDNLLEVEPNLADKIQEEHTFEDWLDFLDNHKIEEKEALLNHQIDRHLAAATYEVELKEEIAQLDNEEASEHVLTDEAAKKVTALAQESITLTSGAITETLAKIMLMQGKINESIAMYEQLVLKYPEKSNYFAAQIELIKKK